MLLLAAIASGGSVHAADDSRSRDQRSGQACVEPFAVEQLANANADSAEFIKSYLNWHQEATERMQDGPACIPPPILLWSPQAGLGDDFSGLAQSLHLAMRCGRLLFIDLDCAICSSWKIGFDLSRVDWAWSKYELMFAHPDQGHDIMRLSGHPSANHPLTRESSSKPAIPTPPLSQLMGAVIRPSPEVVEKMSPYIPVFDDHFIVGLHLRTGAFPTEPEFLQSGDENRFIASARKLVAEYRKTGKSEKIPAKVFVISDDETLKRRTRDKLISENIDAFTIENSVAHTYLEAEDASKSEAVRDRMVLTFAEFFLFSRVDAAVVTSGSLFGVTAARFGGVEHIEFVEPSTGQ